MAAFLARSDSILLSLYLVLWTYSFDHKDFEQSSTKASELSGITYTIIMFSCIIYGFLYERKNVLFLSILVIKKENYDCHAFLRNDWSCPH